MGSLHNQLKSRIFSTQVQLNVNNPHFLIMQGRIPKVLNMKPPEILSMLEEAAGTRMYENKKEAALKTLEKKQTKVDEINKLLDHEILPALEKLKKEKTQYMQCANGNAELDRLRRFCIAFEYVQAEKIRDNAVQGVEQMKFDEETEKKQEEILEFEKQIKVLTQAKEASMGGEVKTLSDKVDSVSQEMARKSSKLNNKENTLLGEKKNTEKIVQNIEDLKKSIKERASAVKKSEKGAADLKQRVQELSTTLEECEKEHQGVLAGKSGGDEEKCLEDQLRDAKIAVGTAGTELKQLKTKIGHCEKELEERKSQLMSKRQEAVEVENELGARKNDVEHAQKTFESIPYKEGHMEALEKDRRSELEVVQRLQDKVRSLSGQLANVQFKYRDPVRNFDRSKVKGVVANLINVKDRSAMTALEVTAGNRLYNVIVDSEDTGKQLLQNGALRTRVTIIPLNKIQHNVVQPRVQQTAARLVGKDNAELALSLVGYNEEVKNAMEFVFGSTIVCKTTDATKEVAFNPQTRTPSVTLEGDIFQPKGLLTGGSRKGGGDLLRQLHELAEAESQLQEHQKRLADIDAQIQELGPLHKKFTDIKAQLELKTYDLTFDRAHNVFVRRRKNRELTEEEVTVENDVEVGKEVVREVESVC